MRQAWEIPYSEVTPKNVYLNRRRFLAAAGLAFAPQIRAAKLDARKTSHDAGGERVTPASLATTYNNYYEFGTGKDEPVQLSRKWTPPRPWTVEISGELAAPETLDLDAILKLAPLEERVYRHRCVEMWSIVVPWIGFPLSALLNQVQPTGKARFVAFETHYDPKVMLSPRQAHLQQLPYAEGLRLDEAMHPLTLLAVGMYGETLLNQNGAPLRLVVPWKYGFKSIKSIRRIRFTEKMPVTTWSKEWPEAYGFYSNVNPKQVHPSNGPQDRERRLGEGPLGRVLATRLFNGYQADVARLYSGMNLTRDY